MPQGNKEFEFGLLKILCDPKRNSIDIGAGKGDYSEEMIKYSAYVFAYEPLPIEIQTLEKKFAKSKISVKVIALSNFSGRTILYTPGYSKSEKGSLYGWSSIVQDFDKLKKKYPDIFPEIYKQEISTSTLDDERISNVGFIKIDVEGAELEVLIGGKRTINESKPSILIEIEERHRQGSTKLVPEFLKKSGYDGFYFSNEKLFQIDTFLIEEHQWKKELPGQKHPEGKHYINNFIFIRKDNERAIKELKTSTK